MRVSATSPGKKIDLRERCGVLKLSADDAGEAVDLAAIHQFIFDFDGSDVGALAMLATFARSVERPRRASSGKEGRRGG